MPIPSSAQTAHRLRELAGRGTLDSAGLGRALCSTGSCAPRALPGAAGGVAPPVTPGSPIAAFVPNLAALTALASPPAGAGSLAYVLSLGALFVFVDYGPATPSVIDGITVVATSVGGSTRWERL